MRSPSSSHSSTEPGARPSFRRTTAGIEICPCAVSFECASAMLAYYHGNATDLRDVGAGRLHVHGVQRLAGGHEEPVALRAAEADVRARLRQANHPDAIAVRRD